MANVRIENNSRINPDSVYLREFANNIESQNGEDGIREKIFEVIGSKNKWCVEFGAWDGKHLSTTWDILNNHGWNGVLIEGSTDKFRELKNNYSNKTNISLINSYVDSIPGSGNSLNNILAKTEIPDDFDFLTIDVDGLDWHIWNSLTNYQPRLVVIEFNPTIPNNIYFVQDPDPSVNHGSSLLAMIDLGKAKGYELIATTPVNAFFVKRNEFSQFNIQDNSINAMHSTGDYESFLFQLYDGSLVLLGNDRLVWHDSMRITQGDIQVLPEELRKFK